MPLAVPQSRRIATSGTVTNANMTVTLTDGTADIDFASATVPRNYIGCLLEVADSAGRKIQGYVYTDGAGNVQNIVSAKGGTTRNWKWKDGSFNANDDTGYTYKIYRTPAVLVASGGSVAAADVRIDLTDTGGFCYFGVDLSAYQAGNYLLGVYDASGYAVLGHIEAAAPAGEGLSGELLDDLGFADPAEWEGDVGTPGWYVDGGLGKRDGAAGVTSIYQLGKKSVGGLYKSSFDLVSRTAGTVGIYERGIALAYSAPATYADYFTATETGFYITGYGAFAGTIDNASLKEVTDCNANGVHIVNTKGGAVRAWVSKHSSFSPNTGTLSYKVWYLGA